MNPLTYNDSLMLSTNPIRKVVMLFFKHVEYEENINEDKILKRLFDSAYNMSNFLLPADFKYWKYTKDDYKDGLDEYTRHTFDSGTAYYQSVMRIVQIISQEYPGMFFEITIKGEDLIINY